jgi:pyridoxine 5-phosphate synthase
LAKLSINVNKVATIRNSRGGTVPSVLEAVKVCVDAGAPGITVHPRADSRHITKADVHEIAAWLRPMTRRVEFNIEGDPRPELLELIRTVKPHQCTLVPVQPGEITSQAGWSADTPRDTITRVVADVRSAGVRVSLFVDPQERPIRWAAEMGADRVEPHARESFATYTRAAELAHSLGLGVNAGHDLDLDNLVVFRRLPYLDEVSIGHALISHALFVGLAQSVREYLDVLAL